MAEGRARLELELGVQRDPVEEVVALLLGGDLVEHSITLDGVGRENELIGNAFDDCCLSSLWGRDIAQSVRDFAIELVRNAFVHGGATECGLEFEGRRLKLSDNGNAFDVLSLCEMASASGGAAALSYLLRVYGSQIIVESTRREDVNETLLSVPLTSDDVLKATPCAFKWARTDFQLNGIDLQIMSGCRTVYVILPNYFSISDVTLVVWNLQLKTGHKDVVFVAHDVSKHVQTLLLESFTGSRFVEVPLA